MPDIKLQHVVSCSSEDRNFPAENLISGGGFKKWKSASAGEKQVSVTIQLEKSSKIHQIDIGNEGSAFVEVLVGKSTSKDDDYQVLLVASAFMSPLDSRAGKNLTSVRMFGSDKLSKTSADQKWDRVKVVCTQPFNKTIQYGLSFIKLHSQAEEGSTSQPQKQSMLGAFKLKSDEPDNIKPGGLFTSRDKEKASPAPLTGAAAVRAASKLAEESVPTTVKREKTPTPQNTPKQVKRKHDDDDERPSSSSSSSSSSKRQSVEKGSGDVTKTPLRKQSTSLSSASSEKKDVLKKTKSEPPKSSRPMAFNKLMQRVVFVMSGFQNPLRGELRDKALEMGAEYCPDWGRKCTHLICAFENTPKYSQVKGKGRIVTKEWINACYRAKKLLPWRKYRLGRAKSPPGGSSNDEEASEEEEASVSSHKVAAPKQEKRVADKGPKAASDSEDTDVGSDDSGDDTEDEIQRIKNSTSKPATTSTTTTNVQQNSKDEDDDDIYNASTDEDSDDPMTTTNGITNGTEAVTMDTLPELPDYFKGRKFFLYGNFDGSVQRRLKRYIVAYNGLLEQYMSDKVTYVVTESEWDENFDQALTDNPSLAFIRPDWVYACDEKQKLVPYQKYVVVPK